MNKALLALLALASLLAGCTHLTDSLDPEDSENHRFRDPDQQSLVYPVDAEQ